MPFNSSTYYRNRYARHADAMAVRARAALVEARSTKDTARRRYLARTAVLEMRQSRAFRRLSETS